MPEVFRPANPEQEALLGDCDTLNSRFETDPTLYSNVSAIAEARSLVERAAAAGIPQVAYAGLRVAVGVAETQADMPDDGANSRSR